MTTGTRLMIHGPLNGRWFVTVVHIDGTTGASQPFNSAEEARTFDAIAPRNAAQ